MDKNNAVKNSNGGILDFKELIWRLLEQWKAIVAFALIIMLLFSGFMYTKAKGASEAEATVKTPEEILGSFSQSDQEIISSVYKQKETFNNMQRYISDSLLMDLDPYNVQQVEISWYIDSDESLRDQLVEAYRNELTSSTVLNTVNSAWDDKYNTAQLSELIWTDTDAAGDQDTDDESDVRNIVSLTVCVPEGQDAAGTGEALEQVMQSIGTKLTAEVGEHKLSEIKKDTVTVFSEEIANSQTSTYTKLYNLNNQYTARLNSLSSTQKEALNMLVNYYSTVPEEGQQAEAQSVAPAVRLSKRNLVIGFLFGCFVYVGIYLLYFVFSEKIFSSALPEDEYNLRNLGEYYSGQKKGLINWLICDSGIYKRHHKGHGDILTEVERVGETVLSEMSRNNARNLLLVSGLDSSDNTKDLISSLSDHMSGLGLNVDKAEIKVSDGRYLSEKVLEPADEVIAVIDKNHFRTRDIKETIEKCQFNGKTIMGAVYTE